MNAAIQNLMDRLFATARERDEAVYLLRRCVDAFPREAHDYERIRTLNKLADFLNKVDTEVGR